MGQPPGKDSHFRKLIAPVIITILCLGTLVGWLAALVALMILGIPVPLWLRLAVSAAVLALAAVSVTTRALKPWWAAN